MRRAVRDYRYEVNEGRMTDECVQYLTQLQKDWERHRVKMGVEALRKEVSLKDIQLSTQLTRPTQMDDRGRESSVSSEGVHTTSGRVSTSASLSEALASQQNIDVFFGAPHEILAWEPVRPPPALGELLDSRYMLPLLFPSDPRKLTAIPKTSPLSEDEMGEKRHSLDSVQPLGRQGHRLCWKLRNRQLREVGLETLEWVDGTRSAARWTRPVECEEDDAEQEHSPFLTDDQTGEEELRIKVTPLTRKPSGRSKSRFSAGGESAVEYL